MTPLACYKSSLAVKEKGQKLLAVGEGILPPPCPPPPPPPPSACLISVPPSITVVTIIFMYVHTYYVLIKPPMPCIAASLLCLLRGCSDKNY